MTTENQESISTILGDLLTASGIVSEELFAEALNCAECSCLPVGRILVKAGALGEGDLSSALQAAQLVRENRLNRRNAIQLLRESYDQCLSCLDLANEMQRYQPMTKLGKLLIKSEILSQITIARLERHALLSNRPLGEIITADGIISQILLWQALELLCHIRRGVVSLSAAAETLRALCVSNLPLEEVLPCAVGDERSDWRKRVGWFLECAGLVSTSNLSSALEIGLDTGKMIGQVLLERYGFDQKILTAALKVQALHLDGLLNMDEAVAILQRVATEKISVDKIMNEARAYKVIRSEAPVAALQVPTIHEHHIGPASVASIA